MFCITPVYQKDISYTHSQALESALEGEAEVKMTIKLYSYHIRRFQLLPLGKVSDIIAVIVDALHAAFEIFPTVRTWLSRKRHASKGDL